MKNSLEIKEMSNIEIKYNRYGIILIKSIKREKCWMINREIVL